MYQQITLVGNLGQDPEMRYTASGVPVTNFSVATSRTWTGPDGQRQEKTVWFRVTAWRRLAETCNEYLSKGRRVLVVGEMEEPNIWTDQGGNTRADLQLTARDVHFLSTRSETMEGGGGQYGGQYSGQSTPTGDGSGQAQAPSGEEDIPF